MNKNICLLLLLLLTASCTRMLHYRYLDGGDLIFYEPNEKANLDGKKINIKIIDERKAELIPCSPVLLDRRTELEGERGLHAFKNYCRAMIEYNNGIYDTAAGEILEITLRGLSSEASGLGYTKIYGLVEFKANGLGIENKTYCSAMVSGDNDAPIKIFSINTHSGSSRKMVSGSCRRALEELFDDIGKKYFAQKEKTHAETQRRRG
jgi:hypothetical protein